MLAETNGIFGLKKYKERRGEERKGGKGKEIRGER